MAILMPLTGATTAFHHASLLEGRSERLISC